MFNFDLAKYQVLGKRILVKEDPEIPQTIVKPYKDDQEIVTGVAVKVGEEVDKIPQGSRVFYSFIIKGPNLTINGEKYVLFSQDQIIAHLPPEESYF